jgi:hypothetical protein
VNSERGPSGFNINLRWSDIIAYIAFFAVIAPAIYFAGVLTERMTDVETLTAIETQISTLPGIERKIDELLKKRREGP